MSLVSVEHGYAAMSASALRNIADLGAVVKNLTPSPVPDLTSQLAVVTGASGGLGLGLATSLAVAGGEVTSRRA
jgi:hypothetical protein